MKKHLLLGISLIAFGLSNAQTINLEELQWNIGNEWRMNVDNVSSGNLDFSAGTGKNWDFSSYAGANGKDTVKIASPTSPTATVKVSSTVLTIVDYKATSSNFIAQSISGFSLDQPSTMDIGLPHTFGKTWNAAGTANLVLGIAVAGSVPSSGTIKLPWGTFNCLLVKEVTSGTINSTVYHWETVEHGRVASYNGSKLLVMQNTNFTTSTKKITNNQGFSVFPNPTNNILNIATDNSGSVKIFNALGNVVKQFNHTGGQVRVDVSNLNHGMYFVQLTSDKGVLTKSFIVK